MLRWFFLGCPLAVAACAAAAVGGCAGASGREPGSLPSGPSNELDVSPPLDLDFELGNELGSESDQAVWQELGLPAAGINPELVKTPAGWLALSRRQIGDSRAPSAWESYLYRSQDGVHWARSVVSERNENLWLRGVAYGDGSIVLSGMRFGEGDGVVFRSVDAQSWQELAVSTGAPSGLDAVVYAGNRFFAFSTFRTLLSSEDAENWSQIDLGSTVMPQDVTFGAGLYLLVGSGPLQLSTDGLAWRPKLLDCALPDACITDPSGNSLQGIRHRALFMEGSFYIDQASSRDTESWLPLPGFFPEVRATGYLIGKNAAGALVSWRPGAAARVIERVKYSDTSGAAAHLRWNGAVEPAELDPASFPNDSPLPDALDFPLASGTSCANSRCIIVDNRLYLVSGEAAR